MTTVQSLARWARSLAAVDVPERILERVRLQHLHAAGAVRAVADSPQAGPLRAAGGSRGAAVVVGGRTAPRRDAARLHAALGRALWQDGWLLGGPLSAPVTAAAWAWSRGRSVEELLLATVAADEVAGRVGTSLLLDPVDADLDPVRAAVAAAVVVGLLSDLDEAALAHAVALACTTPRGPSAAAGRAGSGRLAAVAAGVTAGVDAALLAQAGGTGPLDVLDTTDGLFRGSPAPLRAAFTGLGRAWLSTTLAFPQQAAPPPLQAAAQGVAEILARHVKAADKRLRADQVARIEVELPLEGWVLAGRRPPGDRPEDIAADLPRLLALLVAEHDAAPRSMSEEVLARRGEALGQVAARVQVHHDWGRTVDGILHTFDVLGPVLAGLTAAELGEVGAAWTRARGIAPPPFSPLDLPRLGRLRPGALAAAVRYQSGDLGDARLDELQYRMGADVRVFTTRGGSWPEHRELPAGSPGWAWADTVSGVCTGWGEEDTARALLAADGGADGEEWTAALLGD